MASTAFTDLNNELIMKFFEQLKVSNSYKDTEELLKNVSVFRYEPSSGDTFLEWFNRYTDIFQDKMSNLTDETRIRLLLRKFGPHEHSQYLRYVLPKDPTEYTYKENLEKLKTYFGRTSSLFNDRFKCLTMSIQEYEEIDHYIGQINEAVSRFAFGSLNEEQFRCLIFILGLRPSKYAEIRPRLLMLLDKDPQIQIYDLANEYKNYKSLIADSKLIENRATEQVEVNQSRSSAKVQYSRTSNTNRQPKCHFCEDFHFHRDCPYRQQKCPKCGKFGHKEGFCGNAKRNYSDKHKSSNISGKYPNKSKFQRTQAAQQVKALERQYVTVNINEQPCRLQIDSGSDITIISRAAWKKLGCPKLDQIQFEALNLSKDPVERIGGMNCRVSFNEKSFHSRCYVSKHDVNLTGLDWIGPLNLMRFHNKTEKVRNPTLLEESFGRCTKVRTSQNYQ